MTAEIIVADVRDGLATLPDKSVQCVVTSPPYWALRDYGVDGQIGQESTPDEYVATIVDVFREVRRVLRPDGVVFLNLGDSYYGSGKGRNADGSFHEGSLNGKQGTNRGSVEGRLFKTGARAATLKPKDLVGIPWRVAFALQADGWYLRSDIIWAKPNPMPESVRDRPTKAHEYVFLLTKRERYYYDAAAIAEPAAWDRRGDQSVIKPQQGTASWIKPKTKQDLLGKQTYTGFNGRWAASVEDGTAPKTRNKRSVWQIATQPYAEAHFATFPEALVEPCVLAGSLEGDTVLDPFAGSGTVGVVALRHNRRFVGIDLNHEYAEMARRRITGDAPLLNDAVLIEERKAE